jgi:hypothetical protein
MILPVSLVQVAGSHVNFSGEDTLHRWGTPLEGAYRRGAVNTRAVQSAVTLARRCGHTTAPGAPAPSGDHTQNRLPVFQYSEKSKKFGNSKIRKWSAVSFSIQKHSFAVLSQVSIHKHIIFFLTIRWFKHTNTTQEIMFTNDNSTTSLPVACVPFVVFVFLSAFLCIRSKDDFIKSSSQLLLFSSR